MINSSNIFHHDDPFTIGIEEEYMLCNPETGELINRADKIMESLNSNIKKRYSYELILSEIEVNTSICNSVNEAILEIADLRRDTRDIGRKLGFQIGISGTHPTSLCKEQAFVENDSYAWVSDQLNYYARRNVTFAMHVHVAVKNENDAIHISNSMRQWIAPLLALSTNSPFFEHEKTGMRSTRTMQFGVFPRTNIPAKLDNYEQYERLVSMYLQADTIVRPQQIWWKIRPHMKFGTIEFRICDVQRSLKNVEMLAAICQALVYQSSLDLANSCLSESFNMEYLNDALWKASRFRIDKKIIDPETGLICTMEMLIQKMMIYVEDALNYFGNMHINKTVNNILMNGTECDRQLEKYEELGFEGLNQYLMKNVDYN